MDDRRWAADSNPDDLSDILASGMEAGPDTAAAGGGAQDTAYAPGPASGPSRSAARSVSLTKASAERSDNRIA